MFYQEKPNRTAIARKAGSTKTDKKARTSAENGKKGGRPPHGLLVTMGPGNGSKFTAGELNINGHSIENLPDGRVAVLAVGKVWISKTAVPEDLKAGEWQCVPTSQEGLLGAYQRMPDSTVAAIRAGGHASNYKPPIEDWAGVDMIFEPGEANEAERWEVHGQTTFDNAHEWMGEKAAWTIMDELATVEDRSREDPDLLLITARARERILGNRDEAVRWWAMASYESVGKVTGGNWQATAMRLGPSREAWARLAKWQLSKWI